MWGKMKPSYKVPKMQDFLDSIAKETFGRSRTESIEADTCVDCGGPATEFKDQLSRKEYTISGMCQECQDKIWG